MELGDRVRTPYGSGRVIKVIGRPVVADYMIHFDDGSRYIVVGRLVSKEETTMDTPEERAMSEALDQHLEDLGLFDSEVEPFTLWWDNNTYRSMMEAQPSDVDDFRDSYCGEYDSLRDYALELFEDLYGIDIPQGYMIEVDEVAWRCDYWIESGHVFRSA